LGVLTIKGKMLSYTSSLWFILSLPSGEVINLEADWMEDNFTVEYNFTVSGIYIFEIAANHKVQGGVVALLAEIKVGTDQSSTYRIFEEKEHPSNYEAEQEHFRLINQIRREAGIQPFSWNGLLSRVARDHAEVCVEYDMLAHETPWDGGPWDRMKAAGLTELRSECIGAGSNAGISMRGLYHSPGHRNALLDSDSTSCGIGCAETDSGIYIFVIMTQ
jgi:uncharacterized protein YkwD